VPRERILLLSLDELRDAPTAVLARTAEFLGIDSSWQAPPVIEPVNVSEGKRAPRTWWRYVGELAVRTDRTAWVPEWMVRLNDSESPRVRREITDAELEIPVDVAGQLRRALVADTRRLAAIWGPGPCPVWLNAES
jgi:hypothetical protein